jgi:hypothetical protein
MDATIERNLPDAGELLDLRDLALHEEVKRVFPGGYNSTYCFYRVHKSELAALGVIFWIAGRPLVSPSRFMQAVMKIGNEAAKRKAGGQHVQQA